MFWNMFRSNMELSQMQFWLAAFLPYVVYLQPNLLERYVSVVGHKFDILF